ncbi:MAG: NAD(P)/FAD-dependent oxidoreductase [Vicinamibacterales bacterium]
MSFAPHRLVTTVDVAVVGGGPAGSTCARALVAAGLEVAVLDQARFPRDKVCAGWITPEVVEQLQLDLDEYARAGVLAPFTAFRVGLVGRPPVLVDYGRPVSYGIRREEFDDYLLRRSGAVVAPPVRVTRVERAGGWWRIEHDWRAKVLVGAGGHRCPVARALNPAAAREPAVVAQRAERRCAVPALAPGIPELYFSDDLHGYGWLVPKGPWVNVGFGRDEPAHLPAHVGRFAEGLVRAGRLDASTARGWQGHAYLVAATSPRRVVGDHVLLAGDAAGLASAGSGEGIYAAVRSGRLAAEAVRRLLLARDPLSLADYAGRLAADLGLGRPARAAAGWLPAPWRTAAAGACFRSRAFVRHVLNGTFLHGLQL